MESLDEQVRLVIRLLRKSSESEVSLQKGSPQYAKALEWVKFAPGKVDGTLRRELIEAICSAFSVQEQEIVRELAGVGEPSVAIVAKPKKDEEAQLEELLPKQGWFSNYIEFTRYNEAPMAYHVVSSLVTLGCALSRRCWIDMGHHKIFAPVNAILVGPTGLVHKSTAVGIARDLIVQATLCSILADKITGESLITSLVSSPQQFIPASELSVFFGRQKYMEGLTNLLLRLLDYPPVFEASTQARSLETIIEPTISLLGGSTMSLLTDSTPSEVLSSGFLNRFLIVVEDRTDRIFPKPRKGKGEEELLKLLKWLKTFSGEISLLEESEAYLFYDKWYRHRKARIDQDTSVAEVTQRGTDHMLRMAMLIHVACCNTLVLCLNCMQTAANLLAFLERKTPELVRAIHSSSQTTQTDYDYEVLRKLGGAADHSTLLRRVSSRINAAQLKQVMVTLNESGRVRISTKGLGQYYMIKDEEVAVGNS